MKKNIVLNSVLALGIGVTGYSIYKHLKELKDFEIEIDKLNLEFKKQADLQNSIRINEINSFISDEQLWSDEVTLASVHFTENKDFNSMVPFETVESLVNFKNIHDIEDTIKKFTHILEFFNPKFGSKISIDFENGLIIHLNWAQNVKPGNEYYTISWEYIK